jgi:hypothetical protein
MSQARDIFFDLLSPDMVKLGYAFKKSKYKFVKTEGDLELEIVFNWDGRGGVTLLNTVLGYVSMPYIKKSSKQFLAYELDLWYISPSKACTYDKRIPPMYSKALLDLANNMAFKQMSLMPFEEKYPAVRIQNTVNAVKTIIQNEILPFHQSISMEQILNAKIDIIKNRLQQNDTHNLLGEVTVVKLMCKKMGIAEPDFIKDINIFTNQSIDDAWNMQHHDFDNMEARFNR